MTIGRRQFLRTSAALGATGLLELFAPLAHAASADITHGSRSGNEVALTFHGAGDPVIAQKLLNIFKSSNTPITVFAVGAWLKSDAGVAQKIFDSGHDLGNHTMNHYQMKTLSAEKVDSEINGCAKELISLIRNHRAFFRPSGTQYSTALIRKSALKYGYKNCISYEVDSRDYQDPGKTAVVNNVMKSVKSGSIISLHFGHQNTVEAMPLLLEKLHAKGLTPVTISTLLRAK